MSVEIERLEGLIIGHKKSIRICKNKLELIRNPPTCMSSNNEGLRCMHPPNHKGKHVIQIFWENTL